MSKTYLIQENTLTNIADNVRSLTGVEGEISLDTMSSKLAEAKQSVDNVIGTLEGFGVEIPEGTNIGDLAGIIENSDSFGGTDTSDATAAADEIFAGETAYGPDGKITGTFTIDDELSTQDNLISQIYTALEGKAGGSSSGGTSVETCTVTINGYGGYLSYCATIYENGSCAFKYEALPIRSDQAVTLSNVVCNSILHFDNGISMVVPNITTTNGAEVFSINTSSRDYYIKAPAESGSSAVITFVDDD